MPKVLNDKIKKTELASKNNNDNLGIDILALKKVSLIFRCLNNKVRQHILKLLLENSKMSVTEIYIKLRIEQSVTSQHLAILRNSGFVLTTREGKHIYYNINKDSLDFVQNQIRIILSCIDI